MKYFINKLFWDHGGKLWVLVAAVFWWFAFPAFGLGYTKIFASTIYDGRSDVLESILYIGAAATFSVMLAQVIIGNLIRVFGYWTHCKGWGEKINTWKIITGIEAFNCKFIIQRSSSNGLFIKFGMIKKGVKLGGDGDIQGLKYKIYLWRFGLEVWNV